MRFLRKTNLSAVISEGLSYDVNSQRERIRAVILTEQRNFCAYSERYAKQTDAVEIEHFDPRKKSTDQDDYWNWYVTFRWLNKHKPNLIAPYLPILNPFNDLSGRIEYNRNKHIFQNIDPNDIEAINLINFLGVNKYEVFTDRSNHVSRIKTLKALCNDDTLFINTLIEQQDNLSFATALQAEFGLDNIDELITQSSNLNI